MRLSGLVLCAILIGCAYGASINNVRRRSFGLAASLKRLAEKRDLHPLPKAIDMSKQLAGRAVQKTVSKRLADVNHARRSLSDTSVRSLHARAVENVRELGKRASTGPVSGKNIVTRALNKVRATQKDFGVKSLHARAVENVRELGKRASTGPVSGKNIVTRALNKVRSTQKEFVRQPFQPAFMGFNRIARSLHNTVMKDTMAKLRK